MYTFYPNKKLFFFFISQQNQDLNKLLTLAVQILEIKNKKNKSCTVFTLKCLLKGKKEQRGRE